MKKVSLNIFKIEKQNIEVKNDIKKHNANIFMESTLLLGSMIATSYFPLATTPRILQTPIYRPYTPKSSAEKYCVKIGVIIIGMNCAIEILVTNFKIFL